MKASLYFIAAPAVAAASCTAGDQQTLAKMDVNDIGKNANDCGAEAYSLLTGAFNRDTFNSCFTKKVSISESCSECYADSGEYGAKNCKAACLLGWCKQGCLDCTAPATKKVGKCVGKVQFESITPCLESVAPSNVSLSQAALADVTLSWGPGTCEPNSAIGQRGSAVRAATCNKIKDKTRCNNHRTGGTRDATCMWQGWSKVGPPVLVNPASGKCLDVTNPHGKAPNHWADEMQVQLFTCNGASGQEWLLRDGTLVNPASGKCLDIRNPGSCEPNQAIGQPEANAQVCNKINDKTTCNNRTVGGMRDATCVWQELSPRRYRDETKVQLHTCNGNANQQWALVNQGPERQHLMNLPSGKCLDIYSPHGNHHNQADDTKVQLFTCGDDKVNQHWRFGQLIQPTEMMV